ncbi:ABC transporter substrate-binding protein [Nocardioides sp. W7]|uniref:ABC transporter substrate-binding protein n=1 Tax=Nocardioides sp. W7 TaxID=2931390 RepID=UPI001FD1092B|nr:ABC transporter substrate-binding protein [Nocardioides sp. W7]
MSLHPLPSPSRSLRRVLTGTTALALTAALTACGGTSGDGDSGDGGKSVTDAHVTIASTAITSSLDPAAALSSVGRSYTKQVFDQLVSFDEDGALSPALADSWTRVDDTTMTFTLRAGVTFSSGAAFDADAVVANVERVLSGNPAYSTVAAKVGTIEKAVAVSPTEVQVVTTGPDPILLNRLTLLDIVDPATFETERPAGTGPFQVTEYQEGTSIELERFDDSWRATDNVAEVTFQAIPSATTMASALQTGEVDVAFGLPADVSLQLEAKGFTSVNKSAGSAAITSLIADVEPKLADVRVRQAINYAIDREAFVEGTLGGFGTPNGSQFLQEGFLGYDADLPSYEYDPEKAKQLIKDAGAEGLELPIATTALFKTQAESVTGFLNAVGFKSEVVIEDLSAFIGSLLQKSTTPLLYWQTDYYDLRDIAAVTRFGPPAPGQQVHFDSTEYQALFKQQSQELDEDARATLIQEMAQIMNEEAGVLLLAWPDNLYTAASRVEELPLTGDSLIRIEEMVLTE